MQVIDFWRNPIMAAEHAANMHRILFSRDNSESDDEKSR
jgi:hypothetical protein